MSAYLLVGRSLSISILVSVSTSVDVLVCRRRRRTCFFPRDETPPTEATSNANMKIRSKRAGEENPRVAVAVVFGSIAMFCASILVVSAPERSAQLWSSKPYMYHRFLNTHLFSFSFLSLFLSLADTRSNTITALVLSDVTLPDSPSSCGICRYA